MKGKSKIVFDTDRLVIREICKADFEFLCKMYTQQENMKYISSGRWDWSYEEIKDKFEETNRSYPKGYGIFLVERKEDRRPLGEAGLFNSFGDVRVLELGYIIDKRYWRQGYGLEVCRGLIGYGFSCLGLETMVARMYAENRGSVRICENCGMIRTQTGLMMKDKVFYKYEIEGTNKF